MTGMIGKRTAGAARWLMAIMALALLAPSGARADPADIEAAARGVVRIVIVDQDVDTVIPISHGSGFAVSAERVVTNAHVIAQARGEGGLAIGIVPSDGGEAVYARVVGVSARTDLALLATTTPMHLAPLTVAGNPATDSGAVTAVGYPMNVDRAQGLSSRDIFRAQPPVKSTGFLSGRRPTREFDSLLHTAPIARGNSGGPLLDECGRVVGVNSFGAESGSADAEFFFAVSTRELLAFLRANDITPQVNSMPCRSLADLDAEERQRAERAQLVAGARAQAEELALSRRRDEARRVAEFDVMTERENGMALAMVLLIAALGAGGLAFVEYERGERRRVRIAAGIAVAAVLGAAIAWLARPGFGQVEDRLEEMLRAEMEADDTGPIVTDASGAQVCTLVSDRSRATGAVAEDVPFDWSADGCVNGRTQYGLADGRWTRVFVPGDEAAVSVNTFDPATREYRTERYLLDRESMERIRAARADYQAPACGGGEDGARALGARQQDILSLLPPQPNERLVYRCVHETAQGD